MEKLKLNRNLKIHMKLLIKVVLNVQLFWLNAKLLNALEEVSTGIVSITLDVTDLKNGLRSINVWQDIIASNIYTKSIDTKCNLL